MSQEEVKKGMRPRGDGSGKGRSQKRKRDEDEDGETEQQFRSWLEGRWMRTESALERLTTMTRMLTEDMDELKKREKMRSKVMRGLEREVMEFRSEMAGWRAETTVSVQELRENMVSRLDKIEAGLVLSEDGGDGETETMKDVEEGDEGKEEDGEDGKSDGEDGEDGEDVQMHD